MSRAIVVMSVALISFGFAWPPDYAEQSRADVATCVSYARLTSPAFDAQVRSVDLQTGKVDITSSPGDSRGERAFSKCLLSVRQWRLIDRHLPKPTEPPSQQPPTMAGRTPDTVSR
ncbi:MAG TPA: hypothetical protein VJX92_06915 [Methylomirabilota bacterium]|nr:hypothetical protein [Methylomirabilota bacterium]